LLLCYIGAIVSAFASSVGAGATIPRAVPFLLTGDVGALGLVAALAIASTVVDVSPFSTNGAFGARRRVDRRPRGALQKAAGVRRHHYRGGPARV
jgi:hypothetical protein